MAVIPIEVYEEFEEKFGKEGARKIVKGLEAVISDATDYKWHTTRDELLDAIRKEFISKEVFEEKINWLRTHLEGKIENLRIDLEGKIESSRNELENTRNDLEMKIENTRKDLEEKIENLRIGLEEKIENTRKDLEMKIENTRIDLEGKIEASKIYLEGKFDKLNQKFNFMLILLIIALTLMNPVVAEIIKNLFKL